MDLFAMLLCGVPLNVAQGLRSGGAAGDIYSYCCTSLVIVDYYM